MNALPPILASKLADFRRRVWSVKLTEGLLLGVAGLLVSWLVVAVLDRVMETPGWLRLLLLLSGVAVGAVGLPLKWYRWVWRQQRLEDAARLLRHRFPRLGDQLLGIVELAQREGGSSGRSERLVQAAMEQAEEAVKDKDFSDAVPEARHRQWAWICVGLGAVVLALSLTLPEMSGNVWARWSRPLAMVPRFTFARTVPLPAPLVVPLSETAPLVVTPASDTWWRPAAATLRLPDGEKLRAQRGAQDRYELTLPPLAQDGTLRLRVGDEWQTVPVQPRQRPEMTRLVVRQKLPAYLQYSQDLETELRGGTATVLEGGRMSFRLEAARDIEHGSLDGREISVVKGALETEWREVPAPGEELEAAFAWQDALGLQPLHPLTLKLRSAPDQAPRISARRETIEQVVLDTEVVTFELAASDDFGVKQMGLSWRPLAVKGEEPTATDGSSQGSKVASAGGPETRELSGPATFCAAREGLSPQSLEVRGWVEDYRPEAPRSHSAAFVLHVLDATDHALWLTQQMGKWLDVARESYEREQQLHEMNKELRQLSAAELDQMANRRRIAQQAAAEQANASRLGALNEAGRRLLEQATKNTEFDGKRLESWAQMLRKLDDIAANRMPSVADLLKQAADAQSGNLAAQSSPQSKAPNASPSSPPSSASDPSADKPSESSEKSASSAESAPQVTQGPQNAGSKSGADAAESGKPSPPAPSVKISDASTPIKNDAPPEPSKEAPAGGAARLSLPQNTLGAAPGAAKKPQPETPAAAETPAQDAMDKSIWEQRDLLAEFAAVADQLNEVLASLQASTFVKRLKAASREQSVLAGHLRSKTLESFGLTPPPQPEPKPASPKATDSGPSLTVTASETATAEPAAPDLAAEKLEAEEAALKVAKLEEAGLELARLILARKSRDESEVVRVIQSDLNAYVQRRPDRALKRILGEMRDTQVTQELKQLGEKTRAWLSGHAIVGAEFWADTLDRWAEEMVPAVEGFT
ncbi:MAG: hypothetical protein KDK99_05860 [Verrucomicrobiales bacterium]|nr:hypothetical protein [Verrucomicrobiales bacterium]